MTQRWLKNVPAGQPPAALLLRDLAEAEDVVQDAFVAMHGKWGRLPQRQREVLVLRYYLDLSEAQIAHTLGVSRGAVKSHASRGMSALRLSLELSS